VPLVIIRHAFVRLTQRANVRTIADLLAAAGELWQAVDRQLNTHLERPWSRHEVGASR
jgi:hypothetical protein